MDETTPSQAVTMTSLPISASLGRRQDGDEIGPLPPGLDGIRVAVVHDYLTQRGGAERVVLSLMKAFPGARLVASIYQPEATFAEFRRYRVETTRLNRIATFRKDPRRALPLLASTFSNHTLHDVDLVVCSSSGWAHGIDAPGALKLVYCHSPARWLYESQDYFSGLPKPMAVAAKLLMKPLRRWDVAAAASVDRYLVNSRVVQERLRRAYGRTAPVLWPPVSLTSGAVEPIPGLEPGFLLVVSRQRGYKNVRVICETVESMPGERLVVVGGLPDNERPWCDRTRGLQDLSDEQMRWLYANCKALVATSHEDFGLTPVEAYAAGRPAVVLRAGGYLESMLEGVTGVFVDELSGEALRDALDRLNDTDFDPEAIRAHADSFSEQSFVRAIRAEAVRLVASADAASGRPDGDNVRALLGTRRARAS